MFAWCPHVRVRIIKYLLPLSSNFQLYNLCPSIFYVYILTQQHAVTVIWMVFLPGWQTSLRYNGLWEVLFSPRSMFRGLALTLTVTDAGQFVFIWRSSWWKHFSCNSKSDLEEEIYTSFKYRSEWLLFNANFSAISWREQVNFQWDDDEVHCVLHQHHLNTSLQQISINIILLKVTLNTIYL